MKDPAALIYFDKWISSTNGMKASFRAWYFDLLIYQYDKGAIPNDLDELAGICRVRPSEYDLFKQMVEQVLKQKFKQDEEGRWYNEVANETISKRKNFKEKRTKSGTIGGIIKKAKALKGFNNKCLEKLKEELFDKDINELESYKDESLLKHLLKLYINEDVDEDVNESKDKDEIEKPKPKKSFDPEKISEIFNNKLPTLPAVKKVSSKRKSLINARIKEYNPEDVEIFFESVFELVSQSSFLTGDNDRGWKADFDWILNPNNFLKIIENKYKSDANRNHTNKRANKSSIQGTFDAIDQILGD